MSHDKKAQALEESLTADAHARQLVQPQGYAAHPGPSPAELRQHREQQALEGLQAQGRGADLSDTLAGWLDTLVKLVLIPEIHKQFGGHVPRAVLDVATDLLLQRLQRGEGGSSFPTGKAATLFALNEALRTVDEARS